MTRPKLISFLRGSIALAHVDGTLKSSPTRAETPAARRGARSAARRTLLLVCVLAAAVLIDGRVRVTAGGPKGSSLRVATYNTALIIIKLGPPVGTIDINDGMAGDMSYTERAAEIAAGIIRDDNEIVALNEVFSDDAREVLVQMLAVKYPYYISKIRGQAPHPAAVILSEIFEDVPAGALLADTNDSGLMLFSKYPFVKFSSSVTPPHSVDEVVGMNGPQPWGGDASELAVTTYGTSNGGDGLASKAVAMVRVKNPNDNMIINVAFSHMQASYSVPDPEGTQSRKAQFADIKQLITKSLTVQEMDTQQVYLMGDLNVIGGNKQNPGTDHEWHNTFQDPINLVKGFFACGIGVCSAAGDKPFATDSWGFETSVQDLGISNNIDNARLDYILHNKPTLTDFTVKPIVTAPLCMQHVSIAYEMGKPIGYGTLQLSDHFPVRADFNKGADFCSPNGDAGASGPKVIDFPPGSAQDITIGPAQGAKITFPGSMQWYRIDKPGSYSLEPSGPNADHVGVNVYAATDLSRPLPPFYAEEEPRWGPKYCMTDPPYYVRVFAKDPATGNPDRTWTGDYSISFHEYRGTTPEDSISLAGGYLQPYNWPGPLSQEYPAVWFDFHTNTASSGQFPNVAFYFEIPAAVADLSLFDMSIRADLSPGYPVIAAVAKSQYTEGAKKGWKIQAPKLPGAGGQPKKYFLRVTRDQSLLKNVPMQAWLRFGTTLTYIRPDTLTSLDMIDDWPDRDNTSLQFSYDVPWQVYVCGASCIGPIPFSTKSPIPLTGAKSLNRSFVKNVVFDLWVEGQHLVRQFTSGDHLPGVESLGHREKGCDPCYTFTWADSGNVDDADYWYDMPYALRHDPNKH